MQIRRLSSLLSPATKFCSTASTRATSTNELYRWISPIADPSLAPVSYWMTDRKYYGFAPREAEAHLQRMRESGLAGLAKASFSSNEAKSLLNRVKSKGGIPNTYPIPNTLPNLAAMNALRRFYSDSATLQAMESKTVVRPLSPHLPVYQVQQSSSVSILNRISVAYLTTLAVTYYLILKMSVLCFTYESFYHFLFYASKLIIVSAEIAALALFYNVCHGASHLAKDFSGFLSLGIGKKRIQASAVSPSKK